ncbi:MAG: PAS domain S-box protein [Candidatus Lokiarchaeota archaeon]|nr:PAS domain S-box protein [Candidatus Lokiarchaeota archaeon]
MHPKQGSTGQTNLLGIADEGKLFRHLFETSPNAIFLLDENGLILECNGHVRYLLGYRKDEIVGKVFTNLPIFVDGMLEKVTSRLQELRASRVGRLAEPVDVRLKMKDGSLKWMELMGTTIKIDNRVLMQIIAEDIEPRKRLEHVLEAENKSLKAMDEIRKQFLTVASHELKTPLTSVDGAAQLLDDNISSLKTDDIKNLVRLVRRGSFRLKELIALLLDFSRIEAGRFSLKLASEDLVPIVHDAVNGVKFLAEQRQHTITITTSVPGLRVTVDRSRIEQVVVNLLSNAIKNTPPGGSIEVSVNRDQDRAVVSVKDNGVGITADELDKLFTKFGKIDRQDLDADIGMPGSGLGLFISKEIIGQHGGKTWVESGGRMKGSVFSFSLPLAPGYD